MLIDLEEYRNARAKQYGKMVTVELFNQLGGNERLEMPLTTAQMIYDELGAILKGEEERQND